ncbi:MAG: hypothetical protein OEL91_07280 [Burkholderiaceae bacterium]|nr:hypothetical protein [Burkholderiaceae bacterium]
MFTSLFGNLDDSAERSERAAEKEMERGFAAAAISKSVDTGLNARGLLVERHSSDLVVTGSPAQAIRQHFAASRSDMESASRQITLYDPDNAWASGVMRALSDTAGGPMDRLNLLESGTQRALATIERTALVRRHEETLKVYNVDVLTPEPEWTEIPITLMEGSHLTVALVGPMEPQAVHAMLTTLVEAALRPAWRCPNLLFILPPSAVWIANKVIAAAWPPQLQVRVLNEPFDSATAVWNAIQAVWNHVQARSNWGATGASGSAVELGMPAEPTVPLGAESLPDGTTPDADSPVQEGQNPVLQGAVRVLSEMGSVPGLLGCAVVDYASGQVLAQHVQHDRPVDLDRAASVSAQVLRSQRLASINLGLLEPVEEILTCAGWRHHVLRTIPQHPELFLFALLDKQHADLALARHKLAVVEKSFA